MTDKYSTDLYESLVNGDIEKAVGVYKEYISNLQSDEFIEKIFKPTVEKIEKDFENKTIKNSSMLVAKNTSAALAKIISDS